MKKKLHRGRIYTTISIDPHDAFKSEINASIPVIKRYLGAIDQIKKSFPIKGDISIAEIIKLPYAFNVEEKNLDSQGEIKILQAIEQLAESLIEQQKEGGVVLDKDLNERIETVQKNIDSIKTQSKINIENHKKTFEQEIEQIAQNNTELAETKQAVLYSLLDKIDIHEETVLFGSYLEQLKNTLKDQNTENGKKISFILQELNREINTISAKCSDAVIGKKAICVKVELEKMREQAQNIL